MADTASRPLRHQDKPEFASMKTMRIAIGIIFVVLASSTCALAMAQEVEQRSQASVRQAKPADDRVVATEEKVPLSNETALAPDEAPSTGPSITDLPDDILEGCCEPSFNNPCPCFYGQVEALFFMRSPRFESQPIVVDANTGETFLSTSDLTNMFNPGLRATFGMRLCGGRALEFDYFGLFQGTASAVAVRPDPFAFLIFPDNFFGNVFVDMDRAAANYSSGLQSFAVNFPCCCGCCEGCDDECGCDEAAGRSDGECGRGEVYCRSFEWFGGFRYLNLSERLDIAAQRTVGGGVEEGSYNIRTANNLFGVQLGARLRRTRGRFGYEASGTAGIFGNSAQQTQTVTDFPDFPIRPTVSSRQGGAAFVGWANLSALYLLSDVWNLRAGYNLLWIEGVALAPDQLDFNFASSPSGNILHNDGGLLLHGVNIGVEARW